MVLVDARIHDGDLRPPAPGTVPRARKRGLLEAPLAGVAELRVVRNEGGFADVVVIRGLDAWFIAKVPQLPLQVSSPGFPRLLAPYAGKGDEPNLPRKIL